MYGVALAVGPDFGEDWLLVPFSVATMLEFYVLHSI